MSEPKTKADCIQPLTPWLYHWTVPDDRIGDFRSDAYAVQTPDGLILIDPLPLTNDALSILEKVVTVCLTAGCHQRSAWRYRKVFGVPVYAPEEAVGLEEEPDQAYHDGDSLPGGFKAIRITGLPDAHALLLETEGGSGALFCGDLLIRKGDGPFGLLPNKYLQDPTLARESARSLAQLKVDTLCPAHGEPCITGCADVIQQVLEGTKNSD